MLGRLPLLSGICEFGFASHQALDAPIDSQSRTCERIGEWVASAGPSASAASRSSSSCGLCRPLEGSSCATEQGLSFGRGIDVSVSSTHFLFWVPILFT